MEARRDGLLRLFLRYRWSDDRLEGDLERRRELDRVLLLESRVEWPALGEEEDLGDADLV